MEIEKIRPSKSLEQKNVDKASRQAFNIQQRYRAFVCCLRELHVIITGFEF